MSVFLDIKWDYFPAVFGGRRANIALHVSDGFAVSLSAGRTIQKFRLGVQAKRPSTYPFSAELLPSQPVPSLYCSTGLVRPSFRALHLPVLDMMKFWMVLPPAVEFPLSGSPALQLPPALCRLQVCGEHSPSYQPCAGVKARLLSRHWQGSLPAVVYTCYPKHLEGMEMNDTPVHICSDSICVLFQCFAVGRFNLRMGGSPRPQV